MKEKETILFINACLREKNSRTLQLANAFISSIKSNDQYQIIERNITNLKEKPLTKNSFNPDGSQKNLNSSLAKEFALADQILIAAPFYEFTFPSVLAVYIENISIPNITFKYTETGSEGLCKAKTLTYIYTLGGYLNSNDKIGEQWLKRLSEFYGIKEFTTLVAAGLDVIGNDVNKIMDDATKRAFLKGKEIFR
ncbi:MAG: NAD(P)H-dependent oxidoreductase [Bacilli bacterium]|jgi:FMN-dependent NADH-azoreductase